MIGVDERLWFQDLAILGNRAYALAYKVDVEPFDTTWHFFLSWSGTQWDTLQTTVEVAGASFSPQFGPYSLSVVDGQLYSGGFGIFKWKEDYWEKLFERGGEVFGTSDRNLFILDFPGGVFHFNGTDLHQYAQFQSTSFRMTSGWSDGLEVFIVGTNFSQSIALHGK